jgi:hypothetical protein
MPALVHPREHETFGRMSPGPIERRPRRHALATEANVAERPFCAAPVSVWC